MAKQSEVKAKLSFIRVTPRKAMLVADLVRGKSVNEALTILRFSPRRRTAQYFLKVIQSAVANATQGTSARMNPDRLVIRSLQVGKGPTLKRFRPRAMGRAHNLQKKTSHIFVTLAESK